MGFLPIQLFFEGNRDYGIGSIKFDLILSETHNFSNDVTEHSVEDGSVITDHIKNNLENGSLSGIISNFSLVVLGVFSNRAQDAFEELIRLWKKKILVTIITVMKVYEDVAITNVGVNRSAETGEAISLDISFKKVKIVKLKTVQIDVAVNILDTKTDQNRQASPKVEIGRTTGG